MPRDNHPRSRHAQALARKKGARPPYDRILIVCEGSKTEPLYLDDIRKRYSIPTAHITVLPSDLGTAPLQVVDSAREKFVVTRAYERVYAVFDRDDHATYHAALERAVALDGKLLNDERRKVVFKAVPSVPCFELWPLLHFEEVQAFGHRREIFARLARHIPGYQKGAEGLFALTEANIEVALQRAAALRAEFDLHTGLDPVTQMDELVRVLRGLRGP